MNKISIGTTKEYKAIMYIIQDELVKVEVSKYKFDIKQIHKENLETLTNKLEIYGSLLQTRKSLPDLDEVVLVEIKDKSVLKWVKSLQAPFKYSKEFVKFLNAVDKIPNTLHFIYMEEPVAVQYATEYDFNRCKEKLSNSMQDLLLLDD